MSSQLNIALMLEEKPKSRPRFTPARSFSSTTSTQMKKRHSRRPRQNQHASTIQNHTTVAAQSKIEVNSAPLSLQFPSSSNLPHVPLQLPLRLTPVSCATVITTKDLLKPIPEGQDDDDDSLELIPSSQNSDTSISLGRFKSHPPSKFTRITSIQLADQMARLKEHNAFLQKEAARSELRKSRLETKTKLLLEHQDFVKNALRVCQETYRHEADSAQLAGIHPQAAQYNVVVHALQELRDDIGYEDFCAYRTSHGSPPPSRYWLAGALKLQDQYERNKC